MNVEPSGVQPTSVEPTDAPSVATRSTPLRELALLPIRAYRRLLSPALPKRCKYHPSCSAYAVEAVRSYGVVRGSVLAGWRLLRCNPWSHGGYDPVERQRLFQPRQVTH